MDHDARPQSERPAVILVPGGVMPAAMSYGPLVAALGDRARIVAKDLEVYAGDTPPPGYTLELEAKGIQNVADASGLRMFHLVGYSAGGAAALAFAALYPDRLTSLTLIEPAWTGKDGWTPEDAADWAEMDRVMALPDEARMRAFARWQMRPGVEPPNLPLPPGPPPDWIARRPAGLMAIVMAFRNYSPDSAQLRNFRQPVYYAVGDLSRPFYQRNAGKLERLFPNFRAELYRGTSHLDPPHRAEPERFARALEELWQESRTLNNSPYAQRVKIGVK